MKVKKTDLKVNIQRVKMVSGPITSWQIDGETMETVTDFILGGSRPTPVLLPGKTIWMEEPGRLHSIGLLSRTQLSDFTFTFHFHALEKEMATHSSVLAWRMPGTGEPGGLPSLGSHRVGHD